MNPVTRALQTITAIQSETRELSASSLASSSGRNRPTALSANSKATADLNRDSGAPPIAQVKATTPEAAFAWDREIRIDKRDRVAVAAGRDVTRSVPCPHRRCCERFRRGSWRILMSQVACRVMV